MGTGAVCNRLSKFDQPRLWWFCSVDTIEIYYERVDGYYKLYKRPTGVVVTQQTQYCWCASLMDPPPNMGQTMASIDRIDSVHLKLHSKATLPNEIQMNFDLCEMLGYTLGRINCSGETFKVTAMVLGYAEER